MTADPRMQVVLELMPADAVFIVRRGDVVKPVCSLCDGWGFVDETPGEPPQTCACCPGEGNDTDNGTHILPLLWAPKSNGYVSEYNPWQAGLYTAADKDYRPRGEDPDAHSYTVPVSGYLVGRIQDDTPVAVLVDEIIRLRAELAARENAP